MKTVETIVSSLSDEKLKEAYDEITEWRKEGTLKMGGVVRSVHEEFQTSNNVNIPIHVMDTPFLYEIATRFYTNH